MAWVFKTCRAMTPRTAFIVLIGAVLWLPISFTIATVMHAVLIAKALSLPAWMQLLHPVATVIAKTKLLVLPVYPAAWPQAKQHPAMQALIRFWNYLAAHYLARKSAYRYRQTETAAARIGDALRHTAAATGLSRLGSVDARRHQCSRGLGRATTILGHDGPDRRDAVAVPDFRRHRAALHRALRRSEPRAINQIQRQGARIFPALVGQVHGRILRDQGTAGGREGVGV